MKLLRDAHGMTPGQSKEVKPPGAPSKRFIKSAARLAELEASELSKSSGTQSTRTYEKRPVANSRVPEGLSVSVYWPLTFYAPSKGFFWSIS